MEAGLRVDNDSLLRAWVHKPHGGGAARVTIFINEKPFWSGLADRLESLNFAPDAPRIPCGVLLTLPEPKTRPEIANISLVCDGKTLSKIQADLSQRYIGYVDVLRREQDELVVGGWIQDRSRYLAAVEVDVKAGKAAARISANKHRGDLADAGIGLGRHAFFLRQKVEPSLLSMDDFNVSVAGTTISMPYTPDFVAALSDLNGALPAKAVPAAAPQRPRIIIEDISNEGTGSVAGHCDKISHEGRRRLGGRSAR